MPAAQIRKSVRARNPSTHETMKAAILAEQEDGLQISHSIHKGRGVIATAKFLRGSFLIEYAGELITNSEAIQREQGYALDPTVGCFMFYFKFGGQNLCVDATKESGRLGRLINHDLSGNAKVEVVPIDGTPHLTLLASRDIEVGEEVLYDYGDRDPDTLLQNPWLGHIYIDIYRELSFFF